MLIVMLGTGKGLENGVTKDFRRSATNSVYIWAQTTSKSYKGFQRGRRVVFDNDDIKALRDNIPEIEYLCPENRLGGHRSSANVLRNNTTGSFAVFGAMPDIYHIRIMDISEGRFINDFDIKDKRKVAIIGTRVKQVLFKPDENPIGKSIKISGVSFLVVGVFSTKALGDDQEEETQTVYVPFSTFQQSFNYGNRISWFSLTSQENVPASIAQEKVIRLLAERHSISPTDKRAFGYWNTETNFKKITGLLAGINSLIWFVGVFTLLAGVIGVSNIMLIVVKERTREIGIRRAIGATPFAIVSQIIMETILLTSISGYLGLVFGIIGLEAVSSLLRKFGNKASMFQDPGIDFHIAVIALLVLIVSGAIAGYIPAQRAIVLKPVDAIRMD